MEQKIQDVEADISKAEAKAEKAKAEGNTEELKYWRMEEHDLREEEHDLREEKRRLMDEKARTEVQQQGTTLCLPLKHLLCLPRKEVNLTSKALQARRHHDFHMLPTGILELLWDRLTRSVSSMYTPVFAAEADR